MSRGIRNNNPGNIRVSPNNWKGKIVGAQKKDREFEEFMSMAYGYRALLKNVRTYIRRDGINTIRGIITRWAPPEDKNNTEGYIQAVCKHMGVSPGYMIKEDPKDKDGQKFRADMIKLAAAISRVENGVEPNMADIEAGWKLIESK